MQKDLETKEASRVLTNVYIDGSNLKKGILDIGREIDYSKFYVWLRNKFKVNKVYLFLGFVKELSDFYEELKNIGYEVMFKEVLIDQKVVKANVDVDLAVKLTLDFKDKEFDRVVLVSGDGDFATLIRLFEKESVWYRVIASNKKSCAKILKKTNLVMFLDSENLVDLVCK